MSYLFAFSYCSWGSQGLNTEELWHSLLQWTTFCQVLTLRDMPLSHLQSQLTCLARVDVPLQVFVDLGKLHRPLSVDQHAAWGLGQRPCWCHQERGVRKAGPTVVGCPGVESFLASLSPLATLRPICHPGVEGSHHLLFY